MEARGFAGDASNETSLQKAFNDIHASLGPTEVLVYNAFAFHQANPLELPPSQLVTDFQVNVVGALISAQCVVKHMKAASRGSILFTGGGLALEPEPIASSLAIGKAGIRSLAFSLHKVLTPFHIHVATVTICGYVQEGTRFSPGNISESFFQLHQQPEGKWDREFIYQ
jgi:NAD(P)-dependent dehydrogenase (short-subunit alcohol dehydrogenase family)